METTLPQPATQRPLLLHLALVACVVLLALLAVMLGGGAALLAWGAQSLLATPVAALATPLLYLAPGLALLRLLWRMEPLPLAERLALSLGLSVALPPVLLLLSRLVGLPWSAPLVWFYLLVSVLAAAWPARGLAWRQTFRLPGFTVEGLLLATISAVVLLVRLYAVRDLPAALWSDGFQHTLMAQLLADHGGLFQSWQPYAPLATFTYHYGFHANVAFFHWATGIPVMQSTLVVGQLLNAAALPLAYLLAARWSGNARAGVWAAAIVGCVSLMPAYYVNWGRYTQLAGQTVLAALCVVWAALLEAKRRDWRLVMLAALLAAGQALTHYRVTAFAVCFIAAYGICVLAGRDKSHPYTLRSFVVSAMRVQVTHLAAAGALALLLTLPWWVNVLSGYLVDGALFFLRPSADQAAVAEVHNAWGAITPFYVKPYVLLGAGLGLLLAAWQHCWRMLAVGLWAALVLLITNPGSVGLGGAGAITNFAVIIGSYLILVPLCAYGVALALDALPRQAALALTTLATLALLGWSVPWQAHIAEQKFVLLGREDLAAMAWVRANTPPDARFLANSGGAYSNTGLVGIDAGIWLPLAAGRATTLPPLTYASERAEQPGYAQGLLPFVQRLRALGLDNPEARALLRAEGVGYLYLGPQRSAELQGWIDAEQLAVSPAWQEVYNHDGVRIFKLVDE